MTDTEINIAVAEERGWVWYRLPEMKSDGVRYRCLFHPSIHEYPEQDPVWLVRADGTERVCNWDYMKRDGQVQDCVNDLNAIHAAIMEQNWTPIQQMTFMAYLFHKCGDCFALVNASARQRAEAFLRTVGKWRE